MPLRKPLTKGEWIGKLSKVAMDFYRKHGEHITHTPYLSNL